MGLYNLKVDFGQFALELMATCNDENSWCNMLIQVNYYLANLMSRIICIYLFQVYTQSLQ